MAFDPSSATVLEDPPQESKRRFDPSSATIAEEPAPTPAVEEIKPTPDDWHTALAALGRSTDELLAPGSKYQTELVSPEVAKAAASYVSAPARLVGKVLGGHYQQVADGMQSSIADVIGGQTLESLAALPSFAVPGVAETFAVNTAAKLPEQYGRIKESIKKNGAFSAETARVAANSGVQDLMGLLALHSTPKIRDTFREGIKNDVAKEQTTTNETQTQPTEPSTQPPQPIPQDFVPQETGPGPEQAAADGAATGAPEQQGQAGTEGFARYQPPEAASAGTEADLGRSAGEQPAPEPANGQPGEGPGSAPPRAAAAPLEEPTAPAEGAATGTPDAAANLAGPDQGEQPGAAAGAAPGGAADLIERYDSGDKEIQTIGDLVDHVEQRAVETNDPVLQSAVDNYREFERENREVWGERGDGDQAETEFLAAIEQPKPAAPPNAQHPTPTAEQNPYDTHATSAKLVELRDNKPRPINKLYGPNPTPEQVASQKAKLSAWEKEYRAASRAHKTAVEQSNEWLRQQAEAKKQTPEAAAARIMRKSAPDGGFTSDPIIDYIVNSGGIMSKSTARAVLGNEKFAANKSLWDSAPEFPDPRHNKIYGKNSRQTPDMMAADLVQAGLLPEGSDASSMFSKIQKIADTAHRQAKTDRLQGKAVALAERQGRSFTRAIAKPEKGEYAIAVSDLKPGDKLKVNDEPLTVKSIDPETFAVEMEDGTKFGVQHVTGDAVIYGEMAGKATKKTLEARKKFADVQRGIEKRYFEATTAGKDAEAIEMKSPTSKTRVIITRDVPAEGEAASGKWRATRISGIDGQPDGHNVYDTKNAAIADYVGKRTGNGGPPWGHDFKVTQVIKGGKRIEIGKPESTQPAPTEPPAAPAKIPESTPAKRAFPSYTSDQLRAMLATADPATRGKIAAELGARASGESKVTVTPQIAPGFDKETGMPVEPPKLRPGEAGTGEMFQGADQPFNLAGEKTIDTAAQAKEAELQAKMEQEKRQFEEENQVPFGFGPGAAAAGENLNVAPQIAQLNQTVSSALRTPRNLGVVARFKRVFQAIGGKAVSAKQSLTAGINNVRAAVQTMKNVLLRPPPVQDFMSALKDWHYADTFTSYHVRQFVLNIRKQIRDPLIREAITNYIQADGDMNALAARAQASNIKYRPGYEAAMKLTPEQRTLAANIRQYFDAMLADGQKQGLIEHGVKNYINQLWKRPNRITKQFEADIQSGKLSTNFQFARRRIFDSFFEGEQRGFVPASKDISALIAIYDQSFNKALSARAFVGALRDAKMPNGEPVVRFSGMQQRIPEAEGEGAAAYLIRSKAVPSSAVTADGRPYLPVNHPALRGWRFLVQDDPAGKPVYYQSDMLVHPDQARFLRRVLEPSKIRANPVGKFLLNVGAFAKQTKLSLSLFHLDQEGLHALFHRIDPANLDPIDFNNPVHQTLFRNGLVGTDYRAQELFAEGLAGGGLVSKIPVHGRLQTAFNEYLFKDYIPKLKLNMAVDAYARNLKRYGGKLTPEQVAEITANQANAAFGELNYRLLGRSQTLQDALRLTILAPDFLEARSRFVGQALKPYGKEQRVALILGAAQMYVGARLMNQMLDGQPHWDKPFSVIYNKREYRLRTVMGDVVEAATDPMRFLGNRFSPWLKEGITIATQRDMVTGLKLTRFEQLKHALAWMVPISSPITLGLDDSQPATGTQRVLGGLGVSNKPAKGAVDDAYQMARDYRERVAKSDPKVAAELKRTSEQTYAASDYSTLNRALYENDRERAVAEIEKLIETKGSDAVEKYYDNLPDKPFTGSAALENDWLNSLDRAKAARIKQAVKDREGIADHFYKMKRYAHPKSDRSDK